MTTKLSINARACHMCHTLYLQPSIYYDILLCCSDMRQWYAIIAILFTTTDYTPAYREGFRRYISIYQIHQWSSISYLHLGKTWISRLPWYQKVDILICLLFDFRRWPLPHSFLLIPLFGTFSFLTGPLKQITIQESRTVCR